MSTGTFDDVFKERSTGPYGKPIKCRVVAIDKPYEYKAKNGNNMKAQVAAVSDGGKVLILLCYDQTKFKFLEVIHQFFSNSSSLKFSLKVEKLKNITSINGFNTYKSNKLVSILLFLSQNTTLKIIPIHIILFWLLHSC